MMSFGRALRRSALLLIAVGAGGYAAMNPGVVKAFYEDVYPSDPAKRQALEMCFMDDHKFNRLDTSERDACYKRMLMSVGEAAPASPSTDQPSVNMVDLQRAAAQGTLPRNDIRRIEQNQNATHLPH